MNENYGVIIHPDNFEDIMNMTDEECGKVVHNMIRAFIGQDIEVFNDRFLDFVSGTYCGRVKRDKERSDRASINGKKGGGQKGNTNAKRAKNEQETSEKRAKTNSNTNTNTNTNNIYTKKTNTFVNGCTKSDIDFDSLEIKVVKN